MMNNKYLDIPGMREFLESHREEWEGQERQRKQQEQLAHEHRLREQFKLPADAEIYEGSIPAQFLDPKLPEYYHYFIMGVVVSKEEMLADRDKERRYHTVTRQYRIGRRLRVVQIDGLKRVRLRKQTIKEVYIYVQIWQDEIVGGGAGIKRTWVQYPMARNRSPYYAVGTEEGPFWEREKANIEKARRVMIKMKRLGGPGRPRGRYKYFANQADFEAKMQEIISHLKEEGLPITQESVCAHYNESYNGQVPGPRRVRVRI